MFMIILLVSYLHNWVEQNIKLVMYAAVFVTTIFSSLDVATSQYHYMFLLRPFIMLAFLIQVFRDRNWLNSFGVFNFLVILSVFFYFELATNFEFVYIFGYFSFMVAMVYVANLNILLYKKNLSISKSLVRINYKIEEYARYNSHVLRSPVARLLGLLHLIGIEAKPDDLMGKVNHEALELDKIIREAQRVLE